MEFSANTPHYLDIQFQQVELTIFIFVHMFLYQQIKERPKSMIFLDYTPMSIELNLLHMQSLLQQFYIWFSLVWSTQHIPSSILSANNHKWHSYSHNSISLKTVSRNHSSSNDFALKYVINHFFIYLLQKDSLLFFKNIKYSPISFCIS